MRDVVTKIFVSFMSACLLAGCAMPQHFAEQRAAGNRGCTPMTGSHLADSSPDCGTSNAFLKRGEIAGDRSGGGSLLYQNQTDGTQPGNK
jgi:hypothetical protein